VRDGQAYVSDYFYTESTDRVVHLGPGKGLNPHGGRVSMTGTKTSPTSFADWIHVDGWIGNFTILKSNIQSQNDQGPNSADLSASTVPAGSNLLFMGNNFNDLPPKLKAQGPGKVFSLGNIMDFSWGWNAVVPTSPSAQASVVWCKAHIDSWSYPAAPNDWVIAQTCVPKTSTDTVLMFEQVRETFDHLLVLGAWDLHFNFPDVAPPS
jgi:hypothetical protein